MNDLILYRILSNINYVKNSSVFMLSILNIDSYIKYWHLYNHYTIYITLFYDFCNFVRSNEIFVCFKILMFCVK